MFVIHNPTAGRRNTRKLWAVLDWLVNHGAPVKILETRHSGHATVLAREAVASGADMVVAAGGDGTIAETVAGMIGGQARLGVIPLGTANVLAHEFGLPNHPRELATILSSPRSAPLWPGVMRSPTSTKLFVQMVGAGFDAHVVHNIDLHTKRRIGRGAYVLQTLRELQRYQFPDLTIRLDGVKHRAASVIVSKGRFYGGPYILAPDARPGERGFTVALFRDGGPLSALRAGAALPQGRMGALPGVSLLHASHVEIGGPIGLPVQADGDPAGILPLSVYDAEGPILVAASPQAKYRRGEAVLFDSASTPQQQAAQ
ncbi:YegS/Rv2252/BmrU family lipid kinase [Acetobacter sacchari]|uniref:YegS/Rv2252/BmrU family lipid kinase n=1 Tax=Acetobacter sacchari TaxID=2661687 RepID=A0ABS3LY32_9PROT|nr:YegS/Rv2252/BmrU family lipid kinase [Acetobacter sacchari]MBO1360821.1 YegS/Rv2252/BmrU family lipid kinase [Acetobacter sacchari]